MPRKFRDARLKYDLIKKFITSYFQKSKFEEHFGNIKKYCMFIGYPRSGHSLVGSLLDAHPNMIFAHELDALRYLQAGFNKNQIYHLIITNSQTFNTAGREWTGYTYFVPNQWNGRFKELKIIGDKKGSKSTFRLGSDPTLLQKLRDTIDVEIKFIHTLRNPFDNISRIFLKRQKKDQYDLTRSIEFYFSRVETNDKLKQQIDKNDLLDVKQEALIESPETTLNTICNFLEIEAPKDYLKDCSSIIFKSPKKSRHEVIWDTASIDVVQRKINDYPFLVGYSYDA